MCLVSIITPLYNCEIEIVKTIESVLSQTYPNWEMIIIDDKSEDSSLSVARAFADKDARISVVSLDCNSGPAVARNVGIRQSQGRFLAFLDSDDEWCPEKLEVQIEYMKETGAPFLCSSYEKVDENGNSLGVIKVPPCITYNQLLKSCVIGCLTVIYDTYQLGKVEMPLIRKRQDFGLWLKLLKRVQCAHGIPDVLAKYTVREGSVSSKKSLAAIYQWKIYREVEHIGLIKSSYFFMNYAVMGVLRTRYPFLARKLRLIS